MNSQDFRNLQEAYLDVYGLDEAKKPLPVAKMDAKVEELKSKFLKSKPGSPEAGKLISRVSQITGTRDSKVVSDSYDLYDIILSHLLDEGYAETPQAAEVIMVNMSEDWRESICEGYKRFPYGRVEYQIQKKEEDNPTGRGTPQSIKMGTVVRHFKGGKEIPPVEKREHSPQISKAREAENRARGAENRARRTQERQRLGLSAESYDLYDIILSHLLDEGYADTQEQAQVIMVNMSEDWRESICEELTGERKKRALEKGGYLANRVASGKEGQPLERINRSGDVTMRTTKKGPTKRGGMGFKGKTKSDWYGTDDAHGYANKSRRRRGIEVKDTSDEL
jgi:hypothetical protein